MRHNCIKSTVIAAFTASLFAGSATLAFAEEAYIEEVVVTARKQEESVQDVPIAITALTQELDAPRTARLRRAS